jgi:hypothetical protein
MVKDLMVNESTGHKKAWLFEIVSNFRNEISLETK